jgi:hypothetical protein
MPTTAPTQMRRGTANPFLKVDDPPVGPAGPVCVVDGFVVPVGVVDVARSVCCAKLVPIGKTAPPVVPPVDDNVELATTLGIVMVGILTPRHIASYSSSNI